MSEEPHKPEQEPKPPETPPERRVEVKNSRGTVIGDFNTVVQNYLADPKMRYFLLGLAVLIVASAAVLIWVLPKMGQKQTEIALKTAILPTPTPTPQVMGGDINVVVPVFFINGTPEDPQMGRVVAETLKNNLVTALEEVQKAGNPGVIKVWGPAETGNLFDPANPVVSAQELARAIHAHIVIYGEIDVTKSPVEITPHFYISNESVLFDSRELTGDYQLGEAFPVPGSPLSATWNALLRERMATRNRVLTLAIQALTYYSIHDYNTALSIFSKAAPVPAAPTPGAPTATPDPRMALPKEGREVIYLLAGNAAGKAFQFDQAAQYFDLSLQQDPQYARAMIGKAGVLYMQAFNKYKDTLNIADLDKKLLKDSIKLYQDALKAAHQPVNADIEAKVHFGLGQCLYWLPFLGEGNSLAPARDEFDLVIAAYDAGNADAKFRLNDMAGISHGHLGLIYQQTGNLDQAKKEYEAAIALLKDSFETEKLETYQNRLAKLKATPTP